MSYEQCLRARRFAERVADAFIDPVAYDADLSVKHWLGECKYTVLKKRELERLGWELGGLRFSLLRTTNLESAGVWFEGKCFIKAEFYDSGAFKHARWICPVDERVKTLIGPYIHALEAQVFAIPCAIKKIGGSERVIHFVDQTPESGNMFTWTDWVSMESHHMLVWAWCFIRPFYERGFMNIPERELILAFRYADDYKSRKLSNTNFTATLCDLLGILMSGKQWTSLDNFILNFVVYWFLMSEVHGVDVVLLYAPARYNDASARGTESQNTSVRIPGTVEGDDAVQTAPLGQQLSRADYVAIGANVDPIHGEHRDDGDFLSVVAVGDWGLQACDVLGFVARFGWVLDSYLKCGVQRVREIMFAKSLSLLYTNTGVPVLHALASYAIRMLCWVSLDRFFKRAKLDSHDRRRYLQAYAHKHELIAASRRPAEIAHDARLAVERLSGIVVGEQIEIENKLTARTHMAPLDMFRADLFPVAWRVNWEDNTVFQKDSEVHRSPVRNYNNFSEEFWEAAVAIDGPCLVDRRGNSGSAALHVW